MKTITGYGPMSLSDFRETVRVSTRSEAVWDKIRELQRKGFISVKALRRNTCYVTITEKGENHLSVVLPDTAP